MIDIKFIRENPEKVKQGVKSKNADVDIDKLLELDKRRRELIAEIDGLRAEQNKKSKGGPQDPVALEELKGLKERIKILESEFEAVAGEFDNLMLRVPNLPMEDVPVGKDERDNKVIKEWGEIPKFNFKPKDHLELGESLGIIDTERAAKISGTRFGYLKRGAAMLEFALMSFVAERLSSEKWIKTVAKKNKLETDFKQFTLVIPPVLVRPEAMAGMGYIDTEKDKDERYFLEKDNLFLVGTSEQSVGPMHSDEVFNEKDLPLRYLAFSSCFRREAGSYGKDVKGILRVHQFDKLEMFSYALPEKSQAEHKLLSAIEEELMRELKIPYRVVQLCTGDLARPSASTLDIEAWMPGQNEYRETHSTSNTTDFQSRRLNIRVRLKTKNSKLETRYAHTLNGTAFAIGRAVIAILENYQTEKGTVKIPKALQKYIFGVKEIK